MKRNAKNNKVMSVIAIGLATMIVAASVPVSALGNDDETPVPVEKAMEDVEKAVEAPAPEVTSDEKPSIDAAVNDDIKDNDEKLKSVKEAVEDLKDAQLTELEEGKPAPVASSEPKDETPAKEPEKTNDVLKDMAGDLKEDVETDKEDVETLQEDYKKIKLEESDEQEAKEKLEGEKQAAGQAIDNTVNDYNGVVNDAFKDITDLKEKIDKASSVEDANKAYNDAIDVVDGVYSAYKSAQSNFTTIKAKYEKAVETYNKTVDAFNEAVKTASDLENNAEAFDASKTYGADDIVKFEGKIYKFTGEYNTASGWDPALVEEVGSQDHLDKLREDLARTQADALALKEKAAEAKGIAEKLKGAATQAVEELNKLGFDGIAAEQDELDGQLKTLKEEYEKIDPDDETARNEKQAAIDEKQSEIDKLIIKGNIEKVLKGSNVEFSTTEMKYIADYEKNSDGTYKLDPKGNPIPVYSDPVSFTTVSYIDGNGQKQEHIYRIIVDDNGNRQMVECTVKAVNKDEKQFKKTVYLTKDGKSLVKSDDVVLVKDGNNKSYIVDKTAGTNELNDQEPREQTIYGTGGNSSTEIKKTNEREGWEVIEKSNGEKVLFNGKIAVYHVHCTTLYGKGGYSSKKNAQKALKNYIKEQTEDGQLTSVGPTEVYKSGSTWTYRLFYYRDLDFAYYHGVEYSGVYDYNGTKPYNRPVTAYTTELSTSDGTSLSDSVNESLKSLRTNRANIDMYNEAQASYLALENAANEAALAVERAQEKVTALETEFANLLKAKADTQDIEDKLEQAKTDLETAKKKADLLDNELQATGQILANTKVRLTPPSSEKKRSSGSDSSSDDSSSSDGGSVVATIYMGAQTGTDPLMVIPVANAGTGARTGGRAASRRGVLGARAEAEADDAEEDEAGEETKAVAANDTATDSIPAVKSEGDTSTETTVEAGVKGVMVENNAVPLAGTPVETGLGMKWVWLLGAGACAGSGVIGYGCYRKKLFVKAETKKYKNQ